MWCVAVLSPLHWAALAVAHPVFSTSPLSGTACLKRQGRQSLLLAGHIWGTYWSEKKKKKRLFSTPLSLLSNDPKTQWIRIFCRNKPWGACIYLAKRYILSQVSPPASIAVKAVCWKRHKSIIMLPVSFKYKNFIQKNQHSPLKQS